MKVFGTTELYATRFLYHFQPVFNASTYIVYLERLIRSYFPQEIYLIHDNVSYHKDGEAWDWFSAHRRNIAARNLPSYSSELNALERT